MREQKPHLVALMTARNSDWIIGASARAALQWCDGIVIFAHACEDRTVDEAMAVAAEHRGRVLLIEEPSPVWNEMDHRQRTLVAARCMGATHVANVDDDEILTANLVPAARKAVAKLPPGHTLDMPWVSMWHGLDSYRDDGSHWSRTMVDVVFAGPERLAYRPGTDGYQHHARRPQGGKGNTVHLAPMQRDGGLMHLQFSSLRRLKAKQALYKMIEIVRWPGKRTAEQINQMYDGTTLAPGLQTAPVPETWWEGMDALRERIVLDAEPWQEAECRRMLTEHGRERFAGLDLYGVVS